MDSLRRTEDLASAAQKIIDSALDELRLVESDSVPTDDLMNLYRKVNGINRSINGNKGMLRQMFRIRKTRVKGEIGR